MHKCAAQCCENETYSIQKIHHCIDNCSSSLQKAQQYVQNEFVRVQVIKLVSLNFIIVLWFIFCLKRYEKVLKIIYKKNSKK